MRITFSCPNCGATVSSEIAPSQLAPRARCRSCGTVVSFQSSPVKLGYLDSDPEYVGRLGQQAKGRRGWGDGCYRPPEE